MSRELPLHPSDEERVAADMARELEAMTMTSAAPVPDGFSDRVMLAIADEPLPQPVRAFGLALLGGHVRAAVAAVGDAWRTITSTPAPVAVRAQALALVLIVAVGSLAIAGGAAVGTFGLLDGDRPSPAPSGPPPSVPSPTKMPTPSPLPTPSPSPSPEATPSETAEVSEIPEATETPKITQRPRTATPTATGTDDHGGGSGSSGSSPGSDGGDGDHTPEPIGTDDHTGTDG